MNKRNSWAVLLGLLAVCLAAGVALAQANVFDLGWIFWSGGGGARQSPNYALDDSLEQFDANSPSSASYRVESGFWQGLPAQAATATPTWTSTPSPTWTSTPSPTSGTPTPSATHDPSQPTATRTPPLAIVPQSITLRPGQAQAFQVSGGAGAYTWAATGGTISPTAGAQVTYTAGNQLGDFNVIVSSGPANTSAAVKISGLEIEALGATQLNLGEKVRFRITNPSQNTPPFSWFSTDPTVGSIKPVEGGQQGEVTGLLAGVTEIYARDNLGVESNRFEVIVGNTVQIPRLVGEAGKSTLAHINANNAYGEDITSLQMTVRFDPSLLQARHAYVTYRSAYFSLGTTFNNAEGSAKLVLLSLTGERIPIGRGPILDLAFDVNPTATGGLSSSLALTEVVMADINSNPVPITPRDGLFEVCPACLVHDGDVNQDGQVNILDLQLVINIYLLRYTPSSEEFAAADMSPAPGGDATVNVVDVLKVLNKILGRPVLLHAQSDMQATPVELLLPKRMMAAAGQSVVLPVYIRNNQPVGGVDITLVYTQAAGSLASAPVVNSSLGAAMSIRTNGDNPGYLQIILHSPDTVKTIPAGGGSLFLINLGAASQAINVPLSVAEAAVSDVNGAPLTFSLGTPTVYLPVVVKGSQ